MSSPFYTALSLGKIKTDWNINLFVHFVKNFEIANSSLMISLVTMVEVIILSLYSKICCLN